MKYYGIVPTSQIPSTCIHKQEHHTEQHGGKTVQYWEVWVKDPDALPPVFWEKKEPNRRKIKMLDKIFRHK